jgi:hypothetical protein
MEDYGQDSGPNHQLFQDVRKCEDAREGFVSAVGKASQSANPMVEFHWSDL